MNKSNITWTEATWSPVIGCTKVSQGCKHCYAEREVETRWSKNPKSIWYGRRFADVLCRPDMLSGASSPLAWKKPRRIFVCPRADLFHDDVPAQFIADVFGVMAASPQHTFQVLTKRAERAQKLLGSPCSDEFKESVEDCMTMYSDAPLVWPLPNVWLGVSIEDQATADERIPLLLQTPAAVRWISAEPLLGPVDLTPWLERSWPNCDEGFLQGEHMADGYCIRCGGHASDPIHTAPHRSVDWVVAGGESGPQARPMHPAWGEGLRTQCGHADVPFLFKQWGEYCPSSYLPKDTALPARSWAWISENGGVEPHPLAGPFKDEHAHHELMARVGVRKAGRLLDGALYDGYPEVRHA